MSSTSICKAGGAAAIRQRERGFAAASPAGTQCCLGFVDAPNPELRCSDFGIAKAAADLTTDQLWERPGGAASAGFHLRHIGGSIDRLLTYARGEQLDDGQREALRTEGEPGSPRANADRLILQATAAIESALATIRITPTSTVFEPRAVGRAALPSTVGGILFHIAEHTQRHTGQLITTAKIVRGPSGG